MSHQLVDDGSLGEALSRARRIGKSLIREVTALFESESLLDEFSHLPGNWDGYGALPVDPIAFNNARQVLSWFILRNADLPEEITPKSAGTLLFSWECNGRDAELEIGKSRYVGYIERADEEPLFVQGRTDELVPELVSKYQELFRESRPKFTSVEIPRWEPPRPSSQQWVKRELCGVL